MTRTADQPCVHGVGPHWNVAKEENPAFIAAMPSNLRPAGGSFRINVNETSKSGLLHLFNDIVAKVNAYGLTHINVGLWLWADQGGGVYASLTKEVADGKFDAGLRDLGKLCGYLKWLYGLTVYVRIGSETNHPVSGTKAPLIFPLAFKRTVAMMTQGGGIDCCVPVWHIHLSGEDPFGKTDGKWRWRPAPNVIGAVCPSIYGPKDLASPNLPKLIKFADDIDVPVMIGELSCPKPGTKSPDAGPLFFTPLGNLIDSTPSIEAVFYGHRNWELGQGDDATWLDGRVVPYPTSMAAWKAIVSRPYMLHAKPVVVVQP